MTDRERYDLYVLYRKQGMVPIDAINHVLAIERLKDLMEGLRKEGII